MGHVTVSDPAIDRSPLTPHAVAREEVEEGQEGGEASGATSERPEEPESKGEEGQGKRWQLSHQCRWQRGCQARGVGPPMTLYLGILIKRRELNKRPDD